MGAQLSLLAQTAPSIAISSYVDVLDEVHYQSQLNSSRFLKTCKALDPNGEIVVKVFLKPHETYDLKNLHDKIERQSLILRQLPNVLNYSKILYTDRAGYLIRQHLKTNLYDRLSLRPFLQEIELKFMAFQLLQILADIHMRDITHGDIKTENIMVTSYNWLILTDFSEYIKPKYLPEDNPGEYAFYFDTSQRRTCYVAPERFDTKRYSTEAANKLEKEMDIFSLGCCIFELFTEGRPLFNLSQLFKFKNGEIDALETIKSEIKDPTLQSLIIDMISLEPKNRPSARTLLSKYRGTFFPESFYSFIYEYVRNMVQPTGSPNDNKTTMSSTLQERRKDLDTTVTKLFKDFPKICTTGEYPLKRINNSVNDDEFSFVAHTIIVNGVGQIQLQKFSTMSFESVQSQSALLFLSILLHCLRNLAYPKNKQRCLEMILTLSQYISDTNKLDRVLPFVMFMLFDENSNVKALAIKVTAQLLLITESVNHTNANVFIDYVLPRLNKVCQSPLTDGYVRTVLANTLGHFARSAIRFHELSFLLSFQLSNVAEVNQLQKVRRKLLRQFEEITTTLLTAPEPHTKEALLLNILPICHLFGKERTNDVILSHLITYLNDKNSSLRISLIKSITGVSVLLGSVALEQYILPLLTQTLSDSEEAVVITVIQSLISFCRVGLLKSKYFYDIASEISVLLLHPNFWIREYTMMLLIEMSSKLSKPELYCMMYPIFKPYFEFDVEMTWESLLISSKKPVSRNVYNLLCTWTLRSSKSLFWKHLPSKNVNSFGNNTVEFISKSFSAKNYGFQTNFKPSKSHVTSIANIEIPLTTEDKNWIDKIKSVGLSETELWKLAALRPYVFRVSKMLSRKPEPQFNGHDDNLTDKEIFGLPQTVLFDIEASDGAKAQNTHVILKHTTIKDSSVGRIRNSSPQLLQRPIDMNGSLILTPKSHPVINSSSENVYIQFEPRSPPVSSSSIKTSSTSNESTFRVTNSYNRQHHSIVEFLKTVDVKPPLKSFREFGESYIESALPFSFSELNALKFISSLSDHKPAPAVAIAANVYKPYIVSGSDDGFLKIWDLSKIEKGTTFKPVVNHELGSSITNIAFVANYDVFIVSTSDGCVNLFKTCFKNHLTNREVHTLETLRHFSYKDSNEHAVTLLYNDDDLKPWIITVTNRSRIVTLDIRDMSVVHEISILPTYGAVVTSSLSSDGHWLLCGTTHGALLLWNIIFKVMVKSWTFGDGTPIRTVSLFQRDTRTNEYSAIVAGGSSECLFTIWNMTRTQVEEVVSSSNMNPSIDSLVSKPFKRDTTVNQTAAFENNYVCDFIYEQGNVFYADGLTSEIYRYNIRTKSNVPLLSSRSASEKSTTTKLTVNCSLTTVGKTWDHNIQDRVTYYHTDLINCMNLGVLRSGAALVSGDSSGTIHVYMLQK
ncbi:unnamed protein product [Kluyveromyces dobzhanskii CBS 2104]|uniref:non-specific serine/threonine protein kinase n=1 Tax=Kluyveromyces dobzhanskii CBS 2104 TaxID=1427455 RepID=A0A0A8L342_9SACH|nr:unnamed protein product [Kluyveromyces dobzhanskii CBS 2104]